jgi:hypothetical protein
MPLGTGIRSTRMPLKAEILFIGMPLRIAINSWE